MIIIISRSCKCGLHLIHLRFQDMLNFFIQDFDVLDLFHDIVRMCDIDGRKFRLPPPGPGAARDSLLIRWRQRLVGRLYYAPEAVRTDWPVRPALE